LRKPQLPDQKWLKPKQRKPSDLSRCLAPLSARETLIAVVELSQLGWLVAGVEPQPPARSLLQLVQCGQ
jgi:hypothetical protein